MFFELMHCRSAYPMNENDANLNVIDTLKIDINVMLVIAVMNLV